MSKVVRNKMKGSFKQPFPFIVKNKIKEIIFF